MKMAMTINSDDWLQQFPAEHHTTIHGWFASVLTTGARTPEEVLIKTTALIGRKQEWCTTMESRQLCSNVQVALRCDRHGALQYATAVLASRESDDGS